MRGLRAAGRAATPEEQQVLARWSGFGAVPGVFDSKREDLAAARAQLAELTMAEEYRELRRTTLNAHYTHAAYAQAIWEALGQLGFGGGRVLEPGCGSGNFIGLAPAGAQMTGVERDTVTAAIAAALYPHASIRAESFADTRIQGGYFDAAVGNVPFGAFRLSDPGHNPGRRLSIHNHFIVKSVALTRPGGIVALLTSRYTMDSRNPEARRRIAGLADLVAAIRLPAGAHRQAAGTDAITDLLILRCRPPGQPGNPDGWELAPEIGLPGGQARVNEYFTAHPEFVLGELRVGRGARNDHELTVTGPPDAAPALQAALQIAVTRARVGGLVMTARAEGPEPAPPPLPPLAPRDDQIEGFIQAHPDATFTRLAAAGADLATLTSQPYQPPATQARELRQLLGLRDTVLALLRAEAAAPDDTPDIAALRAELNTSYRSYTATYGPIKRFTWASGRADPVTGEKKQIKRRPPQGGFRNDPLYPLAYALEESFDPATRTAVRADIFTQRVVVPETPLLGADTAAEALAICLNAHGDVRLGEITRLLGAASDAEARAELGTLVYDEPGTSRLVWAPLYLSGDVRAKLAAATDAAATDPRYQVNVAALGEVIPRDLGPAEIEAQLGAGWIAPHYVQQFLRESLGDDGVTVEHTRGRKWHVNGGNRRSVAATATWGTPDACAQDLTQRLLTGTAEQIAIHRKASDGSRSPDLEATEAAKQKARDLADRFSIWVWEDISRARDLSRVYNDRYNAVAPVSFDDVELFTPGLSAALSLRGHQPPAIARVIYQGSAGLVHDTGAGKTLETIIGARERQRLGMSHKPCFVVQKHKVGDFRDEFLRAYPDARLLVADTEDLTGSKRREFIARCATGNPTAIIMSREAFRSIPVSAERIAAFLREEEQALEQAIEDAQASGEDNRTIKQIEADLLSTRERRKEQAAKIGRDRGLCYESTGIDYLVIDEARGYRKGPIVSSLPGMADAGSARSLDLLLKLGYHQELYGETRVCLADATPFTNRITEIYTWLRYLDPSIEDFDSWVRTFGKMATAYEMTPGGDFKAKARLREIINAVDLHLWLRERNDFKLKETLDLTLPVMAGGKPQIIQVPASDELISYASEISWRYDHIPTGPPQKGEDNHLKIQGDAIKAALDLRLVGRSTSQPQKADVTADVIYSKWAMHRDDVYRRADGSEHPTRGSLILVFASLGTPGRARKPAEGQESGPFDQWDFYNELRGQLTARGMPARLIRFIHEAGNAQQKEELFRACRNGEVAVLIGSTEKLGTGTNVQDRCVGLVQVTAPWNWDEPHQELGRVERQGNLNTEFFCIRVVTSPSADAIKWERARQKEQSFRALMSGHIEGRTIRVPDDDLSAAEMMAAASGEPRLLERAELEGTISRLHTLRRAWAQNQTALGYTISHAQQQITGKNQAIVKIDTALERRKDTRGEAFAMTVAGRRHTKRTEAAERLRELLRQQIAAVPRGHIQQQLALGEIGGFQLTATLAPQFANSITLRLDGIPDLPGPLVLNHRELPEKTGIITRLENRLLGLEQARADTEAAIGKLSGEIQAARASAGGSFPQQDEYDQARARLDALEAELTGTPSTASDPSRPQTPVAEPARDPSGPAIPEAESTTQAAPAPAAAADMTPPHPLASHPDSRPGANGEASEPQQQPSPTDPTAPGTDSAAREGPAVPAQAAATPLHDGPGGVLIEHDRQGSLVRGTSKDDLTVRRLLHEHGFRWSRTLTAWYLPRRWSFSARGQRVTALTASLRREGRSFTRAPEPAASPPPGPASASDENSPSQTPHQETAGNLAAAPADAVDTTALRQAVQPPPPESALPENPATVPAPSPGTDTGPAAPPGHPAARKGQAVGGTAPPGTPQPPVVPSPGSRPAGAPEGTHPVAVHSGWGGPLRPERLLYADGTSLTIRGQGEDGDQVVHATAAGATPALAGSDLTPGHLQVVEWETGGFGTVHPALVCPRGADPYGGLSDRDRARWEAFDQAEAWPTNVAGIPAYLVDPGDILHVERRPQSHVMDLHEVLSIEPGTGRFASGLELRVTGRSSTLYYPPNSTAAVGIPAQHPSLTAVIRAATASPAMDETAAPAQASAPVPQHEAGEPDEPDPATPSPSRQPAADSAVEGMPPARGGRDDAPGAGDDAAERIVDAARSRAEARDRAHVPIDYVRAKSMIRRQRAALTRAISSEDPAQVIRAAHNAVTEWNQPGMAWPDDWSHWQRALDDMLPGHQRVLLEDLAATPASDGVTPQAAGTPVQHLGAAEETGTSPAPQVPADAAEPPARPLNNSDLAIALHRLSGWEFARLASGAGTPAEGGAGISRRGREPDTGAHETLRWDSSGITITISAPSVRRHGHLPWRQLASWIGAGMTPARLGLITEANVLSSFCTSRRQELAAAGIDPAAVGRELSQLRDDTIKTVISAALSARGAAAPIPAAQPGQLLYQTAAMMTRPGPAASKDDNTALERLAELRAVTQELYPASDTDIKATIKWWIGARLPGYARALDTPAAMHEWITSQVTTLSGRHSRSGTYGTPDGGSRLWSGASPEGLLSARDGEHHTETLTTWTELSAWIHPGLSSQRRQLLLAADSRHRTAIHRQLRAAAGTSPVPGDQDGEEKEQAARALREALDATWAAIDAAPPPTTAQREQARRTYQQTGPVQEDLFSDATPASRDGQEGREPAAGQATPVHPPPGPTASGPEAQPGTTTTAPRPGRTPPAVPRDVPALASGPRLAPAAGHRAQPETGPARPQTSHPLTSDDIFLSLRKLPVLGFADLICAMDDGDPPDALARHLAPRSSQRAAGEPDTGAQETITCTAQGVRIQVAASTGTRAGALSWPEIADWLRPGLSAGRLQIMRQAAEARLRFVTLNASFRAAGEADLAASAEDELRDVIGAAVSVVLLAARPAATGALAPGGQQPLPTGSEAAALERISHLASALPAWPPQWQKPVSHVQAGDILGHPGYRFQPFRVTAPPRHHGGRIEITGHLTSPGEGEPAAETTWATPVNGRADPPVHVVPTPARSLRPGPPEPYEPAGQPGRAQGSSASTGMTAPQRGTTGAGNPDIGGAQHPHPGASENPTAGEAPDGVPAPAPGDGAGATQLHSTDSGTDKEDAMPPATKPGSAAETPEAQVPGPAQARPADRHTPGIRTAETAAGMPGEETRLMQELDDVLEAIFEHRRATAPSTDSTSADFADIRAAFASLRNALELPAGTSQPGSGNPEPGSAPAQPPTGRRDRPAPEADDFGDIRAAFTDLRRALDLPGYGPDPGTQDAGAASGRLLDQAAAETQACARWYQDTPEWQRITAVSHAARELITAIRQASGDYWAEIRQDIRVRGFTRTLAARTSLAISSTAHVLAGQLEEAGNKNTRIWQAVWGLHRATASFADQVMKYTPPRAPGRMDEVRRIINDLGKHPHRSREEHAASAAALAREGFPLRVPPTAIQSVTAPAAHAKPPQPRTARRP